ncbi:MAG: hypothetical protein O2897_02495 [bacterium]|nr:hypothetical protein [bacterium]
MKWFKSVLIFAVMISFLSPVVLQARPRDPGRERARCESSYRLCKDVAKIDYKNCSRTKSKSCRNDFREDLGQCQTDRKDCLDRV